MALIFHRGILLRLEGHSHGTLQPMMVMTRSMIHTKDDTLRRVVNTPRTCLTLHGRQSLQVPMVPIAILRQQLRNHTILHSMNMPISPTQLHILNPTLEAMAVHSQHTGHNIRMRGTQTTIIQVLKLIQPLQQLPILMYHHSLHPQAIGTLLTTIMTPMETPMAILQLCMQ
jgi:hypothetical protein